MSSFNSKDFGNNIKKARLSKGLSQENLANSISVTTSTVARYESGEIIPNAEQITKICDELEIYEYELFDTNRKIQNIGNSKNPFKSNILYICYNAYIASSNKYRLQKFKLIIKEKPDKCLVDFVDYNTDKIYLTGYLLSDKSAAFFVFENYEPNNPRLEVSEIVLDISDGITGLINGAFSLTNAHYTPCIRRLIASAEDFDIDDNIKILIDISDNEIDNLKETKILYLNTRKKKDYED